MREGLLEGSGGGCGVRMGPRGAARERAVAADMLLGALVERLMSLSISTVSGQSIV